MSKDNNEKKSILQKELNTKEILILFGVIGFIAAYGFIFIYPKYTIYKSAKNNLNNIETEINKYESMIDNMPSLQKNLESFEKERDLKSKELAHDMEDGMFLIGLSKILNEYGVDLVSYNVEEVTEYENFYSIPTTIELRGDYRYIKEVMYYMETQKNVTQILDYSMENYIEEKEKSESTNSLSTPSTIINQSEETEEVEDPKATGEVLATFKFVMYSTENPTLNLNNDDASKWKPGKYNPFKTTSR